MTPDEVDAVFGPGELNASLADRAAVSDRHFVRSVFQVAEASDQATGRRMSAAELLREFGEDVVCHIARNGTFIFSGGRDEPAATLRKRRTDTSRR